MRAMRRLPIVLSIVILAISSVPTQSLGARPDLWSGGVGPSERSKSQVAEDPNLVALKEAALFEPTGNPGDLSIQSCSPDPCPPAAKTLSYSVTSKMVEPEGSSTYDDLHHAYTDANYWNFCTAGAATTALYYWIPTAVTTRAAGYFTEPAYSIFGRKTTYWKASDTGTSSDTSDGYATKARNYLMYIAEYSKPPSFGSPGVVYFGDAQIGHAYGTLPDVKEVLNWEASGHSASYANFFYLYRNTPYITSSSNLASYVRADIGGVGKPLVASVDTYYLPNWPATHVVHAITVIGYSDVTNTYAYLDTCGDNCGSTSNGGIHYISYSNLYTAVHAVGSGGGIVW